MDIEQITPDDIAKWLKNPPEGIYIANFLANKLLYPQALPVSVLELEIEFAILREYLKKNPGFFDKEGGKIIIPESFIQRFANLPRIVWAYIDVFEAKDITKVVVRDKRGSIVVGSILTPIFRQKAGNFILKVENKTFKIKYGTLAALPCPSSHCDIQFQSRDATILQKNESRVEVYGGSLGLLVDGRKS